VRGINVGEAAAVWWLCPSRLYLEPQDAVSVPISGWWRNDVPFGAPGEKFAQVDGSPFGGAR
jgi:hypothetical protein